MTKQIFVYKNKKTQEVFAPLFSMEEKNNDKKTYLYL